jgi:Tol biopolymer transport system component
LYTFDLETGKCDPIEGSEGMPWWSPLSRDRRTAFYSRWLEDPNRFMARDLAAGTDRDLVSLDTIWGNVRVTGQAYLSPDDRWLAVWVVRPEAPGARALAVISTQTGEVRELHRQDVSTSVDRMCGRLSWTPDGSAVLFARPDPLSDGCTLFRVFVEGGEPTPVFKLPPHRFMGFTPDGSHVAFDSGEFRGEIWMLTRLEEVGGET